MKIFSWCIVSVVLFCSACQVGRIPCPRVREAKLRTHFKSTAFSARANAEQSDARKQQTKSAKMIAPRFTQNVTVAEWDCPRPGRKHYLPRSVKENIRKNTIKINSDAEKD